MFDRVLNMPLYVLTAQITVVKRTQNLRGNVLESVTEKGKSGGDVEPNQFRGNA